MNEFMNYTVYDRKYVLQHFRLICLTRDHMMESFHSNFISTCILLNDWYLHWQIFHVCFFAISLDFSPWKFKFSLWHWSPHWPMQSSNESINCSAMLWLTWSLFTLSSVLPSPHYSVAALIVCVSNIMNSMFFCTTFQPIIKGFQHKHFHNLPNQ